MSESIKSKLVHDRLTCDISDVYLNSCVTKAQEQDQERKEAMNASSRRPPTPPKQSHAFDNDGIDAQSIPGSVRSQHDDAASLSSPETSSSGKQRKQVVWDPFTKYYNSEDMTPSQHSKGPGTPLRSILKPSTPLKPPEDLGVRAAGKDGFQAMLESSVIALSSPHRSAKIDSYITFSNTLRAYDGRPDIKAIKSKMPLLSSFIRRDISSKISSTNKDMRDSQLIQQALKLLTIFAWSPELVDSITGEDAAHFIQEAIRTIQDSQSPKVLVTYFLHFLRQQQFPPRIMTSERANAIVTALANVDDRGSNNISQERISIYHRLLTQCRSAMAMRTSEWIDKVLAGLVSSNKETRVRALNCVVESAKTIGAERIVARALINVFNCGATEGHPFFHRFSDQLADVFRDGEGAYVANVWGAIILLLRARYPVTSWEYFSPWLGTIQLCFNSSTISVKIAANVAWGKLIYALSIGGDGITPKNLDLLTRPLVRYLDPLNASLNSKAPRKAAISNVVLLLYYGFRPNTSHARMLCLWEALVVTLVDKLILCGREEIEEGCLILTALLDGTHHKVWRESRGVDKRDITPVELPRLDPKWVRGNSLLVLKTIRNALTKAKWERQPDGIVQILWHHFTKTLADAGAKEVKISPDLMESIAHILTMIHSIWRVGIHGFPALKDPTPDAFIRIIGFLLKCTVQNVGTVCFTDKQIVYDSQATHVFSSSTSSKYSFEDSGSLILHTPLVHIFQMFLKPPAEVTSSVEYYKLVEEIFQKCLSGLNSRRKRLGVLSSCIPILGSRDLTSVETTMWSMLSALTIASLKLPSPGAVVAEDQSLGWEFRDAVIILQWGCCHAVADWDELLEQITRAVSSEQSPQSVFPLVLEPLADCLRLGRTDMNDLTWFQRGGRLISQATLIFTHNYPKDTRSLPTQRNNGQKVVAMGSCVNLFSVVNQIRLDGHNMMHGALSTSQIRDSIEAVQRLILYCPIDMVLDLLCYISEGVSVWIQEPPSNEDFVSLISLKVVSLWASILSRIALLPRHDNIALQRLTPIFCVGLETENESIVADTLNTWNETFACQTGVEYPKRLQDTIDHIRNLGYMSTPDLNAITSQKSIVKAAGADSAEGHQLQNHANLIPLASEVTLREDQYDDNNRDTRFSQRTSASPGFENIIAEQLQVEPADREDVTFLAIPQGVKAPKHSDCPQDSQRSNFIQDTSSQEFVSCSLENKRICNNPASEVAAEVNTVHIGTFNITNSLPNDGHSTGDMSQPCHMSDINATSKSSRRDELQGNLENHSDSEHTSVGCATKPSLKSQETMDFENSVLEVPDSFAGHQKKHSAGESQASFQVVLESKETRKPSVISKEGQPPAVRGRKIKGLHSKTPNSPSMKLNCGQERHFSADSCDSLLDSISVADPVMPLGKADAFTSAGSQTSPSKRELRKRKNPVASPDSMEAGLEHQQGISPKKSKVSQSQANSLLSPGKASKTGKQNSQRRITRTNLRIIKSSGPKTAVALNNQIDSEEPPVDDGSASKLAATEIQNSNTSPTYSENIPTREETHSQGVASTGLPLHDLKTAIQLLEDAALNAVELREAEDMIFDLYSRLRERRRLSESKVPSLS